MSSGHDSLTITPFPLAMVVCDSIYRDPYTGKFTLIGTFSTIGGVSLPLQHPQLFVYTAITGGRGKFPLRLEITHADDDQAIAELKGEIDCQSDPRAIQELAFSFGGLVFERFGEYRISLYANEEFMVERRVLVFNLEQQGQSP
jgi:hypothetical protein